MKHYIIPENLIPQLTAINVATGRYVVPTGDGVNTIISIPDDWSEHLQFALDNSLVVSYFLIVTQEEAFCRQFIRILFQKLREDQTLNNTQRGTLLNTVQLGMNALTWGDVVVARAAFNSIAVTALWTNGGGGRKTWVLAQLDAYINANL